MRKLILYSCLFILSLCLAHSAGPNKLNYIRVKFPKSGLITFKSYCNERYSFCMDYPQDILFPQPEPTNGDGRRFESKDGEAILIASGSQNWNILRRTEITLGEKYEDDLRLGDKTLHRVITYQFLGKDFFVISGYEQKLIDGERKQKVFYQKTIIKPHRFCTAILEYNENQKSLFNTTLKRIFTSFK